MSYHGEVLNTCIPLPFANTACIIVSGDGPNICGHALLFTDGHYFHIAGFNDRPMHMDEEGYKRYISESGKRELGRYRRLMQDAMRGQSADIARQFPGHARRAEKDSIGAGAG